MDRVVIWDGQMTEESKPKKVASKKKAQPKSVSEEKLNTTISSVLRELNKERDTRDRQISALIERIQQGFDTVRELEQQRGEARDKELQQLLSGLEKTFGHMETEAGKRDVRSEQIINKLSESILLDHKTLQEEAQEQEKLQDKKLNYIKQLQEQQTRRTRLIAVPGIIVAFFAVIYMFYTVHVMEIAMTSMSHDMKEMKTSVSQMTVMMNTMSQDTRALNVSMGQLSKDMNVMTHNVAPAMTGIRRAMPWSP
jgi:outer membrane murein-binding lipoprotein Lpp